MTKAKAQQINKIVKYSTQKYEKTYKLLEEYDKSTSKKAEDMADPGRLRKFVQCV
jgi:hypothetical protein